MRVDTGGSLHKNRTYVECKLQMSSNGKERARTKSRRRLLHRSHQHCRRALMATKQREESPLRMLATSSRFELLFNHTLIEQHDYSRSAPICQQHRYTRAAALDNRRRQQNAHLCRHHVSRPSTTIVKRHRLCHQLRSRLVVFLSVRENSNNSETLNVLRKLSNYSRHSIDVSIHLISLHNDDTCSP